ncbi:MAG: Ig domain-containing protein, partial [Bacteroidaceae bacterium]|nr:Ig domain-containing protein [Bacteroidaceae bacterium]
MRNLRLMMLALIALCLSLTTTNAQDNKPILTIGCLSDLHCDEAPGSDSETGTLATSVTTTVSRMKEYENVDVICIGGDIVSQSQISSDKWEICRQNTINALVSAFNKTTTSTPLTGAKTATPLVIATGNHEFQACGANASGSECTYNSGDYYNTLKNNNYAMAYYTGELTPTTSNTVSANANECFYETLISKGKTIDDKHIACAHYQINNIDFIIINTSSYNFNKDTFGSGWTFSTNQANWVAAKLNKIKADNPKRLVFVVEHFMFSDTNKTNSNHVMPDRDGTPILKKAYASYPNLIMLYGHDHSGDVYISSKTSERVTRYNTSGNKIDTTDKNHVDGTTQGTGSVTANSSFMSCFMGSMNYRNIGKDNLYQALMIYVYEDRIVFWTKNFNESTEANINKITPYTFFYTDTTDPQPSGDGAYYLKNLGNSQYLNGEPSTAQNEATLSFSATPQVWDISSLGNSLIRITTTKDGVTNNIYHGNTTNNNYFFKLYYQATSSETKYNCYLYEINEADLSTNPITATKVSEPTVGHYYFIGSTNNQSGDKVNIMGNESSSSKFLSKVNVESEISNQITVDVSNIKNYIYKFEDAGSSPTPTPTPTSNTFYLKNYGNGNYLYNSSNSSLAYSTTDKTEWKTEVAGDYVKISPDGSSYQLYYSSNPYFKLSNSSANTYLYKIEDINASEWSLKAATQPDAEGYYVIVGTSSQSSRYYAMGGNITNNGLGRSSSSLGTNASSLKLTKSDANKAYVYQFESTVVEGIKYGKFTYNNSVTNGTAECLEITSGTTWEGNSGKSIPGVATQKFTLIAKPASGYELKGWSKDGGTSIISGSNQDCYTYEFTYSSTDESKPTTETLTPVFQQEQAPNKYYIVAAAGTNKGKYLNSNGSNQYTDLALSDTKQVWELTATSTENLYKITTTHNNSTYDLYLSGDLGDRQRHFDIENSNIGTIDQGQYTAFLMKKNNSEFTKTSDINTSDVYAFQFYTLNNGKPYNGYLLPNNETSFAEASKNKTTYSDNYAFQFLIPVSGVALNQYTATIKVGDAPLALTATVKPSTASDKNVTWTSSNTNVATVNEDGEVTAVAAGETTITVKTNDGEFTAACVVTVTNSIIPATTISLDLTSAVLKVNDQLTLTATIDPTSAPVEWTSDNTGIATVDQDGKVTAVAEGEATITVTSVGKPEVSASCTLNVIPETYPRTVTENKFGTICLPYDFSLQGDEGVKFYKLAYKSSVNVTIDGISAPAYIEAEEVNELKAGKPYIIYGTANKELSLELLGTAVQTPGKENGLVGIYKEINLEAEPTNCIIKDSKYYIVNSDNVWVASFHAYIDLSEVPEEDNYNSPTTKNLVRFTSGDFL